jgi:hypothetical protein
MRNSANGLNVAIVPFYDHGRGQNTGDSATTLSSWGLASKVRWQGFNLDISIAKRLVFPAAIMSNGAALQDRGIHFNFSYTY